ncbi:MAG: S8 family serine peptidase, partial [Ignavibacteriales bacterium]|nr:S8 family serine peptidase [Ignavibacteriales bacterium]
MKRFSFLLFIILSISIYAQTTYFLKFKESVDQSTIQMMVNQNSVFKASFTSSRQTNTSVSLPFVNTTGKLSNQLHRIIKITFSQNIPQADLTAQLTNPDIYEYIEPQKVYKTDGSVNDSLFNSQWALSKIKASGCWEITQGQDSIIIGVIDTGIDFNHPDIKNKLFINSGETGMDDFGYDKKNNSIDDDNNGFVDDYMGWDFTDRVGFPYDSTGGDYLGWDNIPLDENIFSHGTAVAGIIGAETNNLLGIAGVAPKIKILNLRAFDPDGNGEEDDVAAAVLYAVQMGVKVINMSFGDNSFSFVLRDVIRFAYANNVVLVASSGNTGSKNPHYPSGYSEVICVGNSTPEDYVASSSNFGSTLDLVAPGTGIITLSKGYNYAEFNGTSAAAPFVSAVAGLILSKQSFSNEEVKQILKTTSDDIGAEGWDEKSGSGRLNAEKALRVLAPSLIKFDYPFQDFTTASDTLQPSFTVLSPYFASCNVFWGEGLNPQAWKNLLTNITNQGAAVKVPALNLKNSKDTVFTLRLQVVLTDGRTIEERVNFHKLSSAPQVTVFPVMPAYYGNSVSISTALYSTQPATAKMFYRETGSTEFRNNTLDGFTVNNLFVKQIHYGFVPPGYLKELTVYEVYFEVENLLGIKTIVKDSLGNNFTVRTNRAITQTSMNEMPYSLPTGTVFKDPIPIIAQGSTEILLSKSNDATKTFIYSLNNNEFTVRDSILQRIPKDAGDFNHDGKQEILANWGRNGYILSQSQNGSTVFADVFKNEDGSFWPILVKDIDNDGRQELLAVLSDTTIGIYRVENDLQLTFITSISNFSTAIFGANVFDYPSAVIADIDKNGKNEIWVCDREGDVLCYNVNSAADITPDLNRSFRTEFLTSSSYLTIGDFDGDGNQDITIILHSIEELDIAKFYLVFTYTFFDGQLVPIFASAFIDPASEFNVFTRKAYNSVRMGKFFSADKDDLLLCLFPYSFGFSYGAID